MTILVGFDDGVLRFFRLSSKGGTDGVSYYLHLQEVFKPHTKAVTHVTVDATNSVIATAVSGILF
jgi:hypothetical protein